jgi:hypothetical protein
MMRWTVTEADRDANGRIAVNPFEQEISRAMADIGGQAPPKEEEEHKPRRLGRLELAGLAAGLVLVVALIAGLNTFSPAPAPRLTSPTLAPAATSAPTATRMPTATATATPEPTSEPTVTPEPPTAEVVYVPVTPPCDESNPPYQVRMDVSPYGHVVGFSCSSIAEATERANQLAEQMRAAAEGR